MVLLVTNASVLNSLLVLLCVILVDINLFALMYYWGLDLNSITVNNLIIAVGLAVDYSAHIAHSFLVFDPKGSGKMSKSEIRKEKTQGALTSMGSSVFHGAFSTFLAIVALAGSKSVIFVAFFRLVSEFHNVLVVRNHNIWRYPWFRFSSCVT
jgi:Niemann-Pick C1 protein